MENTKGQRFFASIGDVITRELIIERIDVRSVVDDPTCVTTIEGLRREEVTVTISLVSSGDTTKISDNQLIAWILSKINC